MSLSLVTSHYLKIICSFENFFIDYEIFKNQFQKNDRPIEFLHKISD